MLKAVIDRIWAPRAAAIHIAVGAVRTGDESPTVWLILIAAEKSIHYGEPIHYTRAFIARFLHRGSVAERSKALVLGTSLFGGVGSNPTAAKE